MLSISLLLDHPELTAWQSTLIEQLKQHPKIELKSLRYLTPQAYRGSRLVQAFLAYEQEYLCPSPKALSLHSLSPWPTDDVALLDAKTPWPSCDILLDFTQNGHPKRHPEAQHWWWSVATAVRGPSALLGIAELLRPGTPLHSQLQIRDAEGHWLGGIDTYSSVDRLSLSRTMNPLYWKLCAITQRTLLHRAEARSLPQLNTEAPSPVRQAGFSLWRLARLYTRYLQIKWRERRDFEQWAILFQRKSDKAVVNTDFDNYQTLLPPKAVFWADPFLAEHQGHSFLFVEQADVRERLGHLAVMSIDEEGQLGPSEIILQRDYHLSYPQVFQHRGQWYLLPESGADRSLQLFVAEAFPKRWKKLKNLFEDVEMYDATLWQQDGYWWLFATQVSQSGMSGNDELYLYFSRELTGPWTPHPKNPIVSDARRARPAGQLFVQDGQLIRPAQNCGPRYGYGLVFHTVECLSTENYQETPVEWFEPNPKYERLAMHTLNSNATLCVSDAVIYRPKH